MHQQQLLRLPSVKLTSTSGPITVAFSTLTGGQLVVATALQDEIVGLQWQFQSPAPVGDAGQPGCDGINLTSPTFRSFSN